MKIFGEYIISMRTVLFYPEFDERGNLFTQVIDERGMCKIAMSPSELIDANLNYYGSSLRGARDGVSTIIERINMHPIVMNEKLGLYWFPSKSPESPDCVWFALHQIEDYQQMARKKTRVFLLNGSEIDIDQSWHAFDKKVQRAYTLQGIIESRTKSISVQVAEFSVKYYVNKKMDERNYRVKEE